MCKGSPSIPPPPPPPEPPAEPPKAVDPNVTAAANDEKIRARKASGRSGTILTDSALADSDPNTAKRSILG